MNSHQGKPTGLGDRLGSCCKQGRGRNPKSYPLIEMTNLRPSLNSVALEYMGLWKIIY